MRFRPALNQDKPVGVWVAQQIRFEFQPAEQAEQQEEVEG
jgi:hypothetical protein